MLNRSIFLLCFVSFATSTASWGQIIKAGEEKKLRKHVYYLASDELEGRLPGTTGIEKAARYIAKHFEKAGLKPAGDSLWFQYFNLPVSGLHSEVQVSINGVPFKDFKGFALPFSSSAKVTGPVYYSAEPDTSSRIDLQGHVLVLEYKPIATHQVHNNHPNLIDMVRFSVKKKVSALIFVDNLGVNPSYGDFKTDDKSLEPLFPCIFAGPKLSKILAESVGHISLSVKNAPPIRTANVMGFLDNKAPYTVVIGAHYDHLGRSHPASRNGSLTNEIHNGADDNASGTAGLIMLAKHLQKSEFRGNNYLFIAFTAEESGLLGSNWFTKSSLMVKYSFNYMINMDMKVLNIII